MLFNSLAYFVFFPIVFILFWSIPQRFKWILLLITSYYFYMSWNPKYVVLILASTVVSYIAARIIDSNSRHKKIIFLVTILFEIGLLFIFKYLNFSISVLADICSMISINISKPVINIIIPVGISFYTFQTLGYLIDVYRGRISAETHLGYYATYVSFFPQLVAGPIERTENLLPQIKHTKSFNEGQAIDGLKRMAWGYFKKMAVSDMLAPYVDQVFGNVHGAQGFSFVIAAFFFTLQIYCDFSGYSDIAIGSAKLLGIDLMDNFNFPYFATSIKDFWNRWHISLTSWFRDYVYIPLGGNRCSKTRRYMNVLITFLLSGLWHGANWTFVVWGGLHGIANATEVLVSTKIDKLNKYKLWIILRWILVFAFCNVAWIFFRANTLEDAIYVITHAFDGIGNIFYYLKGGCQRLVINKHTLPRIVYVLGIFIAGEICLCSEKIKMLWNKCPRIVHWLFYYLFAGVTIVIILGNSTGEFIYFQF